MKSLSYYAVPKRFLQKPDVAYTRLYRMGLTDIQGCPELMGLEMLASLSSGCLYDDLGKDLATTLYTTAIGNLIPSQPDRIYADLAQAYSDTGEPIPKPIQLLSKDERCLTYFLIAFFENWREYLLTDGFLEV